MGVDAKYVEFFDGESHALDMVDAGFSDFEQFRRSVRGSAYQKQLGIRTRRDGSDRNVLIFETTGPYKPPPRSGKKAGTSGPVGEPPPNREHYDGMFAEQNFATEMAAWQKRTGQQL